MKKLVASFIILMFVVSPGFGQGTIQKGGKQIGMMDVHCRGISTHMMGRMHPTYSVMVHHIFIKANALNLTDTQRKELAGIPERYIYPMIRKEADLKISHMRIMGMLHDPSFDPAKVKSETKTSNEIKLEMANMAIDALADIRNAIGVENFKKVAETKPNHG
jgi:hypothetical protein